MPHPSPLGPLSLRPSPLDVLAGLAALLDKSLVLRAAGEEAEPRYGMLETIRAYGLDRLAVSGEEDQVRDRHAAYYGALAEAAEPGLTGPEQVAWMDRAEREHDNLRAALGWLLAKGDAEAAVRLAWNLRWFWSFRGHLSEGQDGMARALVHGAALSPLGRARAQTAVAGLAYLQGEHTQATALLDQAVQVARDGGDRAVLGNALLARGMLAASRGEREQAEACTAESARVYRALGNHWGTRLALIGGAHAAVAAGDVGRAGRLLDEAEAQLRAAGAPWGTDCYALAATGAASSVRVAPATTSSSSAQLQALGKTLPGLKRSRGLNAAFSFAIAARSSVV